MLIATGQAPEPPVGARLELLMNSGQIVGTRSRTGQIDFRERNLVTNVKRGQPIAVWYPARGSRPGRAVDGLELAVPEEYAARESSLQHAPLPSSKDLLVEPLGDGRVRLRATHDGILQHDSQSGALTVAERLEIQGDVGLETGNIHTIGDAVIHGSVLVGSSIDVHGHLTIGGTIEEAVVHVGGDLKVGGGILGGEDGFVQVGGQLSARHAQSVRLQVGGDVDFRDGCFGVRIQSDGNITSVDGRGQLRGGTYEAKGSVRAKEIGSESGVPTFVCVGAGAEVMAEIAEIEAALSEAEQGLRKLRRDAPGGEVRRMSDQLDQAQAARIRAGMKLRRDMMKRQSALNERLATLTERLRSGAGSPTVDVLGTAHPGVVIQILHHRRVLESNVGPCRFVLDDVTGQITTRDLPRAA